MTQKAGDFFLLGLNSKLYTVRIVAVKDGEYTVGTDIEEELYGGVIYTSSTELIRLPTIVSGMSVSVVATAAVLISVAPDRNEKIILDGVDVGTGVTVVSTGALGDRVDFTYYGGGTWYATTSSWTEGEIPIVTVGVTDTSNISDSSSWFLQTSVLYADVSETEIVYFDVAETDPVVHTKVLVPISYIVDGVNYVIDGSNFIIDGVE